MWKRCAKIVCRSWSRALFPTWSPRTVPIRSVRRESHRFLWQTLNYRHTSSSHKYFRGSTRSWAFVKCEIKSVLLDGLGTGPVHHQPASRSLFPEVTWYSSRLIVIRTRTTAWTNSRRYLKSLQFETSKNHELQDVLNPLAESLRQPLTFSFFFFRFSWRLTHPYGMYRRE